MQVGNSPRRYSKYKSRHPVILALPRGGVSVAAEVAAALDAPLDFRKIGLPNQPELAMGAVTDGEEPTIIRNSDVIELSGISADEFDAICEEERTEIERRRKCYLGDRVRSKVKWQVVIIIDDGIAAAQRPLWLSGRFADGSRRSLCWPVPVAPLDTIDKLQPEVDAIICLDTPEDLGRSVISTVIFTRSATTR